ncbi:Csu type fimbrial protein [Undibacterium sp. RuRC25W]|uniref:Csu type fimbrial protein n=1 Tax=Undibacterium sp. RuRC25W TaxID=3413047 RepID=UPI003BF3C43A
MPYPKNSGRYQTHTDFKRLTRFLLLVCCIAGSGRAHAAWCKVTGGGVAFGAYNPLASSNLDTTGSLVMQCNSTFNVILSISLGSGKGATYSGGRKMTNAKQNTLIYNLYTDATRTQVLGDGTGGSVTMQISGRNTYTQPIWARILGNQRTAAAGSYVDSVVVTISY